MFKIVLDIVMYLYMSWFIEIYIGFRILKTVFESSFTHKIVQKQSALIPFLEFLFKFMLVILSLCHFICLLVCLYVLLYLYFLVCAIHIVRRFFHKIDWIYFHTLEVNNIFSISSTLVKLLWTVFILGVK